MVSECEAPAPAAELKLYRYLERLRDRIGDALDQPPHAMSMDDLARADVGDVLQGDVLQDDVLTAPAMAASKALEDMDEDELASTSPSDMSAMMLNMLLRVQ
jgi:hypothetical protein